MENYDCKRLLIIGMLRIAGWQLKLLYATGGNFDPLEAQAHAKIGRASCRERV